MAKQRSSCNNEEDPVIIQINQGRSCDCHTEGNAAKPEASPFPFKGETQTACPVYIGGNRPTISSEGSESTLSVVAINSPPNKGPLELPLVTPRDHSSRCALEVSVFEKHADGCSYKRREKEGRHPIDDKAGSYDVVNRMVYHTCAGNASFDDHGDVIKNSLKSFRLNDPTVFGKDLKVKRSRIETLPILPNYDNCIMRAQPQKTTNPFRCEDNMANRTKTMVVDGQPVNPLVKSVNKNMEVLSVYIRKDKGEKVPPGFQKLHYRGDSCKLHDPNDRNRQILGLQQVISETASGAELAKSNRRFSPVEKDTRVMAAVGSPLQLPKGLYAPVTNSESDESMESYKIAMKPQSRERGNDSDDVLPQRRSTPPPVDEEDSRAGLFGCFRKGKPKRQQQDSFTEDKNYNNRKVTHSDSQPKRHTSNPHNQRKFSGEYSNRRNY